MLVFSTHDRSPVIPSMTTLQIVRRFLFVILMLGMGGTAVELLLLKHDEGALQLVPLVLLGLGLVGGVATLIVPRAATVRVLQVLMVLFVGSGIIGVGLHYSGNQEFELEMHPSASGMTLVSDTLTGATPVLAPGSMTLLGIVGLAFTYRHPFLRLQDGGVSSQEAQS